MRIVTVPDVTGDGTAHKLSEYTGIVKASWFQINYVSGSGPARIGDSAISTSRGILIPGGSGQFGPPDPINPCSGYMFEEIYLLVPNTEVVSLGYVV